MERPATVRVEEAGTETSSYRDATDERRRVLHVRGSSPRRVHVLLALATVAAVGDVIWLSTRDSIESGWFVPVGLTALALLVQFGPAAAWRSAQRARFELGRRELLIETGPFGARTRVEAWSARAPVAIDRASTWGKPFVRFLTWDLYAERDDGRRVHLATLYDEASVRFVTDALRETYLEAEQTTERNPFAVRFGPMPEAVTCEGDVDDPEAGWKLEVRCPRGNLTFEVLAAAGLLAIAPFMAVLVVMGLFALGAGLYDEPDARMALCSLPGVAMLLGVAIAFGIALRDQLRITVLRWRGRLHADMTEAGVDLYTTPWRARPLPTVETRTKEPIQLAVAPLDRNREEAKVEVSHVGRPKRVHAPIGTDEAHYLAKVVAAYEAWRPSATRPPSA